jgi:hypothetical protein
MDEKAGIAEIETGLITTRRQANELKVTDDDSYLLAGKFVVMVKERLDWVEAYWEDDVKKANDLHKSLVKKREDWLNILRPLLPYLNGMMSAWRQEKERKRREEELSAQAEAKRIADEQALLDAQQLEDAGRPEEAQAVMERAAVPPPVSIPSSVPKVADLSIRVNWKFRITNPASIKPEYMIPDESTIGTIVRKMGKNAEKIIGGIEVYPVESAAVRRG